MSEQEIAFEGDMIEAFESLMQVLKMKKRIHFFEGVFIEISHNEIFLFTELRGKISYYFRHTFPSRGNSEAKMSGCFRFDLPHIKNILHLAKNKDIQLGFKIYEQRKDSEILYKLKVTTFYYDKKSAFSNAPATETYIPLHESNCDDIEPVKRFNPWDFEGENNIILNEDFIFPDYCSQELNMVNCNIHKRSYICHRVKEAIIYLDKDRRLENFTQIIV